MTDNDSADSEWAAFIKKLEDAEEEFVRGRPAAFQSLWSRADDVTLCGGFGGVERGWQKVTGRLDWVSRKYAEGTRTREEVSLFVSDNFACIVQTEVIHYCVPGKNERLTQALRATMVFRREQNEWRIVHRHADSQTRTNVPV